MKNEPGLQLTDSWEVIDVWYCFDCGKAVPVELVVDVRKSNGEPLGRIFPIKGCQDCVETAEALQRLREAVEAARDA